MDLASRFCRRRVVRVRPRPRVSSLTSFSRCASPPLSVGLGWPSLRYPRPVSQSSASERAMDFWLRLEKLRGFLERHLHDVADAAFIVEHLERRGIVAAAMALGAGRVTGGKEAHLHLDHALPQARFAAAALAIEGETPGAVAAHAGERHLGKERPDFIEYLDVSGGRRAGGLSDGRLIDLIDRFEMLRAVDARASCRLGFSRTALEVQGDGRLEHSAHQRALARTGDAGDHAETPDREAHIHRLQVV